MSTSLRCAGRSLAGRLDELGSTLEGLREQLREAVAAAVGRAVGGAVAEGVRAVLRPAGDPGPPPDDHPPRLWHGRDGNDEPRDGPALLPADYAEDDEEGAQEEYRHQPARGPRPSVLGLAAAVGCEAAAWWLRRRAGRCRPLGLLAVGLCFSAAAYLAGAGLVGPLLGLIATAGLVRSGTAALGCFGTS